MVYIVIGVCAVFLAGIFDFVSLKGIPRVKQNIGLVVIAMIIYAIVMASIDSEKFGLPIWLVWIGWILLTISLPLLIYSWFINLPFRRTYIENSTGNNVIRTGAYALVRHPGVFWAALVLISLILISQSKLLLIATPIWLAVDVLHVVIQDKFFFGKMFEGYEDYRKETPCLIPNRKSISYCLKTLRQSRTRNESLEGG